MVDFKYDFSFLIKMIKFVFLPVLAVVILTAFIIFIYSKKVKKKDIKRYNYLVEFWTTLLAIMIIGSLFAVTIGFSVSLSNSIKMYDLIKGNEFIYYMVLLVPLIPFIFLCVYIYRIVVILINKPKKVKSIETSQEDIVPAPNFVVPESLKEKEKLTDIESKDDFISPLVFTKEEETDIAEDSQKNNNLDKKEKNETIEENEEIEVL